MFVFQNSAVSHAQTFLDSLARTAEHQLLQYDNLMVIDDVIKGRKSAYCDGIWVFFSTSLHLVKDMIFL